MRYSTIEGVIRQTIGEPIMQYQTEKMIFRIPSNGGYNYRFNECVDQIADLIDRYFDTQIEDVSRISDLLDREICDAIDRQAKQNELDNINGGSK
jgi:hypothetical protein